MRLISFGAVVALVGFLIVGVVSLVWANTTPLKSGNGPVGSLDPLN